MGSAPDGARPPPAAEGAWDALFHGLDPRQAVPRDVALRAWVLTHGPLPGVDAPAPDGSIPACGLPAERWVRRHWATLTPAQRAAIEGHERGERHAASRFPMEGLAAQIAGYNVASGACTAPPSTPWTQAEKDAANAMLAELRVRFNRDLGYTLRDTFAPTFVERRWINLPGNCGSVPAQSHPRAYDGGPIRDMTDCAIELAHGVAESPAWARALVAHEVFHCYQFDAFQGSFDDWNNSGYELDSPTAMGFVIEGAAAWAGEEVARGTDFSVNWWRYYLTGRDRYTNRPGEFDLLGSNYDGIGFYAHLAGHGANVWRSLIPIVNMSGAQAFAHLVASAPAGSNALANWPASVLRRPWPGGVWEPAGWHIPAAPRRTPFRGPTLAARGHVDLEARTGAQRVFEVPLADDVDLVLLAGWAQGHGTFDGEARQVFTGATDVQWCLRPGGCTCPGDALGVASTVVQVPRRTSLVVALAGDVGRATEVSLTARHVCDDASEESPAGGFDPCLTGAWHIDRARELAAARRTFPSTVRVTNVRGDVVLTFDGRGAGGADFRNYCFETESDAGGMRMTQKVIFNGSGAGRYRTAASTLNTSAFVPALSVRAEINVGGHRMNVPVPVDQAVATGVLPNATRYRCTPRELLIENGRGTRYTR